MERMSAIRLLRLLLALLLASCVSALVVAESADDPVILFFHEEECPDCALVEELLVALVTELPESAMRRYEIAEPGVIELLAALVSAYEMEAPSVPVVFVGDEVVVGAGRTQEFQLRAAIGDCTVRGCHSPLERIRPPSFPWLEIVKLAAFVALFVLLAAWQLP